MNQTEATPDFQGSQVSLDKMQNTKKNTTTNLVKEPSGPQLPRQFRDFQSMEAQPRVNLGWISRIGESGVLFFFFKNGYLKIWKKHVLSLSYSTVRNKFRLKMDLIEESYFWM